MGAARDDTSDGVLSGSGNQITAGRVFAQVGESVGCGFAALCAGASAFRCTVPCRNCLYAAAAPLNASAQTSSLIDVTVVVWT
jgi:hypothetical protein